MRFKLKNMINLKTQYHNFIQQSKDSGSFKSEEEIPSYESWIKNKILKESTDLSGLGTEFSDWDVTLLDGLEDD